jgi:hypothetical protein
MSSGRRDRDPEVRSEQVFRRKGRAGADPAAPDGIEEEYPADDLAGEEDYAEDDYAEDDDELEEYGEPAGEPGDYEPGFATADAQDDEERPGRRAERDDLSDPTTWTRLRDSAVMTPAHLRSEGPWDSSDSYPEAERIDLGCLLVPVRDGADVQIGFSEEAGVSVAVVAGESALQLLPFAAPRSSGLWHEVLPEIAGEVANAGGRSEPGEGPFGPELLAWISPPAPDGSGSLPPQPLRFLGVDGPRWFLRGLISGPAAVDAALARPLEDIFGEVVVVRGEHAVPPRQPLEIRLPQEAQQLLEGQLEEQEQQEQQGMPENPFERGPEITETR